MQAPLNYTAPPQTPTVQSAQPASQTTQAASQNPWSEGSSKTFVVLLMISIFLGVIGIFINGLPDVQGAPLLYDYDSNDDGSISGSESDGWNRANLEFNAYKVSMQSASSIMTGIASLMIIFSLFLEGVNNSSMPNGVRIVMTAGACLILYNGLPLSIF